MMIITYQSSLRLPIILVLGNKCKVDTILKKYSLIIILKFILQKITLKLIRKITRLLATTENSENLGIFVFYLIKDINYPFLVNQTTVSLFC